MARPHLDSSPEAIVRNRAQLQRNPTRGVCYAMPSVLDGISRKPIRTGNEEEIRIRRGVPYEPARIVMTETK
jgi:hypothetical protein